MISFGPIPSRRLGRSLGINNIPPKTCPYACVYCQVGRTPRLRVERETFYEPEEILHDVEDRVRKARLAGESIDYLTFVPDGEPVLDINLGCEIELLRPLGVKIAVITNGSLIWREDVRKALMGVDWVSLKVDAVREQTWRQINRPHGKLRQAPIRDGALAFARTYGGKLVTETMLVADVNDSEADLRAVADFLGQLEPAIAYLSIPTRPPAEDWVCAPGEEIVNRAYQILSQAVDQVEYLIGYEGNSFAFTGNAEEDLLSITAVHPMREEAVDEFLERAGVGWPVVHRLIAQGQLIQTAYEGHRFYVRKIH
jgi:wyosine [tRNA(Phe)-imidazoG37] synthetase (radical SAM superfamily)